MDMETVISIGDFLVSVPGQASALVVRTLSAAFFICSGIQMFDFKRKSSLLSWRRVIGLFLFIFGVRFLLDVLFYFQVR